MNQILKRILVFTKKTIQLIIILLIVVLLFEWSYRYYIIDFYKDSWQALNASQNIESQNIDVLILGDSFSAARDSYVSFLQKHNPDKTILNASVAGIGIRQHRLFAQNRIQKTNPKTIIYQVYVGNDLLDVSHLTNWEALSFLRNMYWTISDQLLSIAYLNRKLSFLKQNNKDEVIPIHIEDEFDKNKYTSRQKILIKADPAHLEKTVTLTDDFLEKYHRWKYEMEQLIKEIPPTSAVHIVFIPHCIQLNSYYQEHMEQLGASIRNTDQIAQEQYTFYKKAKEDFKAYKNVTLLNPLPFLKQKDTITRRLYYANDPHFNTEGHKVLFEFLNNKLF